MVEVMHRATGAAVPDIIRMASLTPARLTGLSGEIGSLEAGKRADVVVLSRDLRVEAMYLGGEPFRPTM
jgi:N-acetylglucosamine-6-phosphate deacetylase